MDSDEGQHDLAMRRILEDVGERMDDVTVEQVVVGSSSRGYLRNAHKVNPEAVCCPGSAEAMPHSGLRERKIQSLHRRRASDWPMRKAPGIAVVSALGAHR